MYFWMYSDGTNELLAVQAFKSLGSNAVPTLIRLMDPNEKGWVNGSVWIARMSKIGQRRKDLAVRACGHIGPEALPALPQIVRLLDRTNYCGSEPVLALYRLGPPGIHVLTNALATTPDPVLRRDIAGWLRNALLDPKAAASACILALKDKDVDVRREAAWSLGTLQTDVENSANALAACLDDPSNEVKATAIQALEWFGPEAKPAVPRLIEFVKTNQLGLRVNAHRILLKVDPEAAGKLAPYDKGY
jgi:HEAT repeat protein